MSLTNIFEEDAGALQVKDDEISGIANLAKRAKLLEKQVLEIRYKYDQNNYTKLDLSKEYKISRRQINNIVNRNVWNHI